MVFHESYVGYILFPATVDDDVDDPSYVVGHSFRIGMSPLTTCIN